MLDNGEVGPVKISAYLTQTLRSIMIIPVTYSSIIGPAMNHIVTPLPSGVMAAPKIAIARIAYRMFFLQKSEPTAPDADTAYITSGN